MRRAHDITAAILHQAQETMTDGFSDDPEESTMIDEAIEQIARRHRELGLREYLRRGEEE